MQAMRRDALGRDLIEVRGAIRSLYAEGEHSRTAPEK